MHPKLSFLSRIAEPWSKLPPGMQRLLRLLGRVAYAGLLLVLCGATAYVSFNLFVRSGVVGVPDLRSLEEAQARDRLQEQGLQLQVLEGAVAYDETIPAGSVLRQDPEPRTLVKRGSAVSVTLSLGPQVISVPSLAGQTVQSSQVALAAAGLTVGRTLSIYSDQAEPGLVVDQMPAAGANAAPGAAVDLVVGLANPREIFLMPDLIYRDYEGVRRFFEQRGFRFGSIKFEVYEGVREGVILRQFPLPGHPLRRQDAIALVVSTSSEDLSRP